MWIFFLPINRDIWGFTLPRSPGPRPHASGKAWGVAPRNCLYSMRLEPYIYASWGTKAKWLTTRGNPWGYNCDEKFERPTQPKTDSGQEPNSIIEKYDYWIGPKGNNEHLGRNESLKKPQVSVSIFFCYFPKKLVNVALKFRLHLSPTGSSEEFSENYYCIFSLKRI
jgi:hypothetical protein